MGLIIINMKKKKKNKMKTIYFFSYSRCELNKQNNTDTKEPKCESHIAHTHTKDCREKSELCVSGVSK